MSWDARNVWWAALASHTTSLLPAVSEHMGQGQAMPQQGIVQNADANAQKSEQDQTDLEAATIQNLPDNKAADVHFDKMNVKKLTRAQKSKLVDQVLKVSSGDSYKGSTRQCSRGKICALLVLADTLHSHEAHRCCIDTTL